MITDVKLEVERKDLKTVEIKLQPWQVGAIFELLGMKILLNSANENEYKITMEKEDIVKERINRMRN